MIAITLLLAMLGQSIDGPATSPRDRLVRLELTEATEVKSAIWRAFGATEADLEKTSPLSCVLVGPPGRYEIWCVWVTNDGALGDAVHRLSIEGTPPDPPKPPNPPPNPPTLTELGKIAYQGAVSVPIDPGVRARESQALASLWRTAARDVLMTSTDEQRQVIVNQLSQDQKTALGIHYAAWRTALQAVIDALNNSPLDLQIPTVLSQVFVEVADGWEAACR